MESVQPDVTYRSSDGVCVIMMIQCVSGQEDVSRHLWLVSQSINVTSQRAEARSRDQTLLSLTSALSVITIKLSVTLQHEPEPVYHAKSVLPSQNDIYSDIDNFL